MATTLQAVDKTQVKMRWQEEYVTKGLNEKLFGAVAAGFARGGNLIAKQGVGGQIVYVEPDPVFGDIVAVYADEANVFQTTVRFSGEVSLDVSALSGQYVYIALYVAYTQGSETTAEWRAYTQAQLDAAAEKDSLVIAGYVYVRSPDIQDADATPAEFTPQWVKRGYGQVPWVPIVRNGGFDTGFDEWMVDTGSWSLDTADTYRGKRCLKSDGTGAAKVVQASLFPVLPGQKFLVRAVFKGTASGAGTTKVGLRCYADVSRSSPVEVGIDCDNSVATWTVYDGMVQVPSGCYAADVMIDQDASVTEAGARIDDVQVYLDMVDTSAELTNGWLSGRPSKSIDTLGLPKSNTIMSVVDPERFKLLYFSSDELLLLYEGASALTSFVPGTQMDLGTSGSKWHDLFLSGQITVPILTLGDAVGQGVSSKLLPVNNGTQDIGITSIAEWRDLFLAGNMNANQANVAQLNANTLNLSAAAGDGVVADLVPSVNGTLDFGADSYRWRHLFLRVTSGDTGPLIDVDVSAMIGYPLMKMSGSSISLEQFAFVMESTSIADYRGVWAVGNVVTGGVFDAILARNTAGSAWRRVMSIDRQSADNDVNGITFRCVTDDVSLANVGWMELSWTNSGTYDPMWILTSNTPGAADPGPKVGAICFDSGHIYVYTAANTWKSVVIS